MLVAESTIGQSNAIFDHVLAYVLGHASQAEKAHVESMLAAGNSTFVETHQRVQEMLGQLPSVLAPVVPPPFLKEKVMSQISASQIYQAPEKGLVQGMKLINSFSLLKRTAVFASLLLGGVFVSAYTVEHILDQNGMSARIQQSTQSDAFKQSANYQVARSSSEQRLTEAAPIEAPEAALADESDSRADETHKEIAVGPSGHMQTNFGLTQAYINLTSEPSALQYQFAPASSGINANGRVIWDETHGDALLVVSKLQPNVAGSHYVLWYMHEGGTPERMLNFNAASAASMSFFVNRAPGAHVSGVMITLERSGKGRLESQEVLHAEAKQRIHS